MKLSIVIVNYNVKYFLQQCLISVKQAIQNTDAEVFVVDNASADGSAAFIRQNFPWVKLLASETNLGFSKGNNLAIYEATGQYILLLNPDTVVAEDTFTKCLTFMDSHPEAGAIGVRMIDGTGKFLPESKRGLPAPWVAFYKAFGLSYLFPKSKIFGRYHLGFFAEHETNEVDVLSGAFMLVRKKALDETGLMDEDFFMYGEDIDLSFRIQKAGYNNYYFPETTIIHYKGESTRKGSLNYVKVFYNAMIIFAKKHFGKNKSGLYTFFLKTAIIFRGFLTILSNLFSSSYLFLIDALLSFAGIYFIKTYWEDMIKYTSHYYPNEFLFIVVPVYITIWIFSTFMAGGYDKPFRIWDIIRGIFFGTLAIAAVYAFLPNEWRFSRAMILLGATWTGFEMMLTRLLYHVIRYQSLSIEREEEKRAILVGGIEECSRAENLLHITGSGSEIVSSVQNAEELKKLSSVFNINEIIFCSADIAFGQIITSILLCGSKIQYKILNRGSDVFIGSNSKNTAGDLYSFNHSMNLAKPAYQRRKRLADLLICFMMIPMIPFNIFLIKNVPKFISNWFDVLFGSKTWVGYAGGSTLQLPLIKNGVISIADNFKDQYLEPEMIGKLNALYAKHYSVTGDLKLIFKNYRDLGK